jgi:DNA-binding SARP family transcriptional activator
MDDDVRVSVLGDLKVVRKDGTIVTADQWRTGKTMDLLRLLALSNGQSVRTDGLIAKLWPDVDADRAGASLRTATSQIRRATQANCIVRKPWGLVLEDVWVDATEFDRTAQRVRAAAEQGDHAGVLANAQAAEELYRGDFHAHADDSDWALAVRNHLIETRRDILCDAAAAALALKQHRAALRLATTAVGIDPASESAHRILMRSHAELGDVGSALRVFETYRANLAAELGADPSAQTRELHLRLLRSGTV